LKKLRDKGNSVFLVEHDPDVIRGADYVIDVGPRAGQNGGEIVYSGPFEGLSQSKGLTADFLNNRSPVTRARKPWSEYIEISNACLNNLKNVSTKIPKGVLTCVTGVAGSGKSSLINDVFLGRNRDAIVIDQSPIGRSSRSNPATYVGIFDEIRKEISRATNTNPSLFSFNSAGACPKCKGLGTVSYEMNFLDEVRVVCDECQGKRYTEKVLAIRYNGKNIDDILHATVAGMKGFFHDSQINKKLQVLTDVGLDYLELGQPLSTLSGGEAQRIKLASELHKKGNVYVMDEPTTGLHMADIAKLLSIIRRLVDNNNTVVVIEHNLDVIKNADWIIDLGPEGGSRGGQILFEGTPEDIIKCFQSYTGKFLKKFN
jgi:excinuclease UvrABC ATPase subunit